MKTRINRLYDEDGDEGEDWNDEGDSAAPSIIIMAIIVAAVIMIFIVTIAIMMTRLTVLQPRVDHSNWLRSKKAHARVLLPLLGIIKT